MQGKHVGGFCEPGPSHLKNLAALGRELQRRGHRFTLFHVPELEADVVREGVSFSPLLANSPNPIKEQQIQYPVESNQEGHSAKNFISFAKQGARLVCEAAPDALRAERVDCVLADMSQPAVATVAEHLKLPYVTMCHAVPLHRDPGVPPDFLPWQHRTEWWAQWRNRLAYRFRDFMIRPLHRVLNEYRQKWGLPDYRVPEDSFSPYAQITQLVPEFDFPRRLPDCFHYVGPYRRGQEKRVPFPFDRLDGRPLVYATMGTSRGHRSDLWVAIASGCAELDVQLVISLGGAARTHDIENLPGRPLVVDYAPQIELLAKTHILITHAGLNTAMEALAAAVPMVAIPITGDQFGVAARVAYRGAGKIAGLAQRPAEKLTAVLRDVLNDSSYRSRAGDLQRAILKTRGAQAAAEIIEQLLATGRPVRLPKQ